MLIDISARPVKIHGCPEGSKELENIHGIKYQRVESKTSANLHEEYQTLLEMKEAANILYSFVASTN